MAAGGIEAPILLTGGSGQVGAELRRLAAGQGLAVIAPSRAELNLGDPDGVAAFVASRAWSAVINCAAYTAVDKAQTDVAAAWRANALGPAALAAASALVDLPMIHVSTDYVFDGAKPTPYVETDPVGPLGVYGASKEGGEQAVRTANSRHVILRTAWVVSPHGSNFVKTMLRLGADRPLLRVVDDQRGCPTSATDIAATLILIARRMVADRQAPAGTYHFVNSGEASWRQFAEEIFAVAGARGAPTPEVEPIASSEYPTPARRPENSRLATDKLQRDFGIMPRPWKTAIAEVVQSLVPQAATTES